LLYTPIQYYNPLVHDHQNYHPHNFSISDPNLRDNFIHNSNSRDSSTEEFLELLRRQKKKIKKRTTKIIRKENGFPIFNFSSFQVVYE
jgi:hypothetical protein